MAELPILMSGPMVRAVLEGRKTQTRRVLKPQPDKRCGGFQFVGTDTKTGRPMFESRDLDGNGYAGFPAGPNFVTPYPRIGFGAGDLLYVRETWAPLDALQTGNDPGTTVELHGCFFRAEDPDVGEHIDRWRPSIHMPKELARIWLEVTEVRIQRLQEISDADAIAEGAQRFPDVPLGEFTRNRKPAPRWSMESPVTTDHCLLTARYAFGNFWNKLADESSRWDASPWVAAYTYKRVRR